MPSNPEPVKRYNHFPGGMFGIGRLSHGRRREPNIREQWLLAADYDRDIKALRKRGRYWKHLTWLYRERLRCEEGVTAEQAKMIERLREKPTGRYDVYMDALKSEHDTLLRTGHAKTATGTTRAMMVIGEILDAVLENTHE